MNSVKLTCHKILNWEYWPMFILYLPVSVVWLYHSIRARSFFFFNAANPSITNGGFMMESKKEIYDLIPTKFYPKTLLVNKDIPFDEILNKMEALGIFFPVIAKPDIGLRGSAVKKINSARGLLEYSRKSTFNFLIQDFIPYPNEVGIFYVRYPDEERGRITGIVSKEFLTVTGDGVSTIEQLLKKKPRYALQLSALKAEDGEQLQTVLECGKQLNLVPYGNHARGAKFINATHLATPLLNEAINELCLKIPGFYFGRIDIMYNTFEELERGQNYAVVELNGSGSEPTHIYDPKHSIIFAWKELIRHINLMAKISRINNKKGIQFLSYTEGMEQLKLHKQHNKKITSFI